MNGHAPDIKRLFRQPILAKTLKRLQADRSR